MSALTDGVYIMKNDETINYQFTLILKNVDEDTPNLEDILYEAGCDDALINFLNRTVYLDFDRQALSLEEAILSAIHNVESAPKLNAIVTNVAPNRLVTESEIAKRIERSRQIVSHWQKTDLKSKSTFPKPTMMLNGRSPLWNWYEVAQWLFQNNLIDRDELDKAYFLENINSSLEARNNNSKDIINKLEEKLVNIAR